MIVVEKTGKTVEDALNQFLSEYNVDRENVQIEVLEAGNRGFLGLLGNKLAKIRITLKTPFDHVKNFIDDVIKLMDVDVSYDIEQNNNLISVNFSGKNVGLLIGKRGETLDSFQFLCNLVANKDKGDKYIHVALDAENYRNKREQSLKNLAHRLANKVIQTRKSVTLEPMNAYERKIIHVALQDDQYVETYSIGEEPYRKVVIALK